MFKNRNQVLSDEPVQQKPLRLKLGVVIVVLLWLIRFGIPLVFPGATAVGVLGGLAGGLAIFVWWAFFSQAPRFDRWFAVALMIVAMVATRGIIHESIGTGMRGLMFYVYSVPVLCLAFVIWAVACRNLSVVTRRVMMVTTILLACGGWTLVRSDGMSGGGAADFAWRWAKTSEELLMAQSADEPMTDSTAPVAAETETDWPGFRGQDRDGIIHGVRIETDWSASPPKELWRQPVGPGCSSFAVHGNLIYTQEQRGEDEAVSCYNLTTGKLVWRHLDPARFWDSHAGAGPRGTPTLSKGRVFTLGATGIMNVLESRDGDVVWSRNATSDTGIEPPGWGISSSPLVIGDVVIVAVVGSLIAYDLATGDPRWFGPDGGAGYSSPHQLIIDGIPQVLLMSEFGARSFVPSDGKLLWDYSWPQSDRILQPAMTADGDVLLNTGGEKGMSRITIEQGSGGWTFEERWNSNHLQSYFNDCIVHKGHVYGFSGPSLACIDLKDGNRKWKGGRYGGQIILIADQDLLLILTEKGDLALVEAVPDKLTELARFPAIKGKTWNHPVLTGDILLVRNTVEMAAFQLSPLLMKSI